MTKYLVVTVVCPRCFTTYKVPIPEAELKRALEELERQKRVDIVKKKISDMYVKKTRRGIAE